MLGALLHSNGARSDHRARDNRLRREEESHDRKNGTRRREALAGRWGRRSGNCDRQRAGGGGREWCPADFRLHLGWEGPAVTDASVWTLEGRRLEEASRQLPSGPPDPPIGGPVALSSRSGGSDRPTLGRGPSRRSARVPATGEGRTCQRSTHPGRPVSL